MLKQLQEQIERLKKAGVTYVDARWYPVEEANHLMMWNGNLKNALGTRKRCGRAGALQRRMGLLGLVRCQQPVRACSIKHLTMPVLPLNG